MNKEILERAINIYGPGAQKVIAIEECSELIKEICKKDRGMYNKLHMAEEIADLEIMLVQLGMIHGKTNCLAGFSTNNIGKVIKEISYLQELIVETLEDSRTAIKCIPAQIEEVEVRLKWLKKDLKLEKLVEVYKDKKLERLEERLNLEINK